MDARLEPLYALVAVARLKMRVAATAPAEAIEVKYQSLQEELSDGVAMFSLLA